MHDLVIRGGTVVDGLGAPSRSPATSRSTTAGSPRSGGVDGAGDARPSTPTACW